MSYDTRELVNIIRYRIGRGFMPPTMDQLMDIRGSLESAALDFAGFIGASYDDCLSALREVYPCE